MDRLEIAFKNVHAFRALAAWMYTFTKESVFMIINREEIKLIYEDASRGTVMGFLKFYKNEGRQTYESVESIKVNCTYSNNEFTFEFNPECLKQALDCMAEDKRIVKMELKDHEDGHILLFTGYTTGCFERSISKFYVNLQNSPPQLPSMNRLTMKFEQNDLNKLQIIAKKCLNVKDNLVISVRLATDYNTFQIKYSLPTGSQVCHQFKHPSENQDNEISKVAIVRPQLLAKFFKLGSLNQVSCCVKNDGSLLFEAENILDDNLVIKVHLKGLSDQ